MHIEKAKRFLSAARICYERELYDSCVNRCYYAIYRTAILALEREGFRRPSWNHGVLIRKFREELVQNRRLYSRDMVERIEACYGQRLIADYGDNFVEKKMAERMMECTEAFIEQVERRVENG